MTGLKTSDPRRPDPAVRSRFTVRLAHFGRHGATCSPAGIRPSPVMLRCIPDDNARHFTCSPNAGNRPVRVDRDPCGWIWQQEDHVVADVHAGWRVPGIGRLVIQQTRGSFVLLL